MLGTQASALRKANRHAGAKFLIVGKGKLEIRPALPREGSVRARLALDARRAGYNGPRPERLNRNVSRVDIIWVGKMRDTEETIRQIEEAFADVAYPGREALFNDHCCECADVSASYAGRRWTEIALADVLAGRETSFLSPAAWRYYLPALMIWCMRAPEAVDVIQDNLVYQLEPRDDTRGVPEWFHERARGFSREQRLAIVAYLGWYRERDEALWEGTAPVPRHV